jgi:putative zinc finger/helix-turn-helix YgiT family protein
VKGMGDKVKQCPNGHGGMELKRLSKTLKFRGVNVAFEVEHYVCSVCGLEVGGIDQAARTQRAIADAYRKKTGLLTGEEIRKAREKKGWTQDGLAKRTSVGVASIKRWEGGLIQTQVMDKALREAFQGHRPGDMYTGNRPLSLPRVKLILRKFESTLKKKLLVKNDKMLYAAKYLCYADMLAFRELGTSMSGATYAWLPHGPQLNNYRELVDRIIRADESKAEPLTPEEERIITRISRTFPDKIKAYKAVHNEEVWAKRSVGALIPYSDAEHLKAV